jgi:hypothetical protein
MNIKFILLCFAIAVISVSTYIYWPLWKELNGRAVDEEMTQRTNQAIKNNKIDPTYLDLATATGGSVCSADGETTDEKNSNLQKCIAAMNHRELVKSKDTQIRQRFLTIKGQFFNVTAPTILILWSIVFFIVLNTSTQMIPIALLSMVPNVVFWVFIGGTDAIGHPELSLRSGSHLPLIGALLTGILVLFSQIMSSKQKLSKNKKRGIVSAILLIGFIPSGLILLMAGSC